MTKTIIYRVNLDDFKIEYDLNSFCKHFMVKIRIVLLFSSSKFKFRTEILKYMTIRTDFDIINYTKNSESSMKIASLTPVDTNKKIR